MTAERMVDLLSPDMLVGFNLAMAREDLRSTITTEEYPVAEKDAIDCYIAAFNEAFFGSSAIEEVDHCEKAAEVIYAQLGCLAADQTLSLKYISEQMNASINEVPLVPATNQTLRQLIDTLMVGT